MKRSRAVIQSRQNEILKLISQKKEVSVEEISRAYDISAITVRRDLKALSEKNLVIRVSGGARISELEQKVQNFNEKEKLFTTSKCQIAKYISTLIPNGSTICCNSGTTTLEVCRAVSKKDITVITNNAQVFFRAEDYRFNAICTGGIYDKGTRAFVGNFAASVISRINADFCILGVNGIDSECGVTTPIAEEAAVNNMMMKCCKGTTIIATTSEKIGKVFCFTSLNIDQVELLVTDSNADPEEVRAIRNRGVEVVFADKIKI